MAAALVVGIPTILAGAVWLLIPELRGKRLLAGWLFTVIVVAVVFICVELFVRPVR